MRVRAVFIWAILVAGPLVLPLAFLVRPGLPEFLAEALLVLGVITLFLSICATEAIGSPERRRPASE